jgi:hypothetical protein
MENSQAICKWARLAGLILGDGFISMIPYSNHKKSPSGFTAIRPLVCLTNEDATIIKLATDLYDEFGVKYYLETRNNQGLSKRPIMTVSVLRFDSVTLILTEMIPWLVGDKKARAEILLRYVSKERRGRREFDPDDAEIIRAFLKVSPNARKGKPTRLAEVLRDYEQNSENRDDIARSA